MRRRRDRLRIGGDGAFAAVGQDFDQTSVRFQSHAQHGVRSGGLPRHLGF